MIQQHWLKVWGGEIDLRDFRFILKFFSTLIIIINHATLKPGVMEIQLGHHSSKIHLKIQIIFTLVSIRYLFQ